MSVITSLLDSNQRNPVIYHAICDKLRALHGDVCRFTCDKLRHSHADVCGVTCGELRLACSFTCDELRHADYFLLGKGGYVFGSVG